MTGDGALGEQTRAAYDTIAEGYAAHFPGTEPEQAVDLAMIDHLVAQLAPGGRDVLDAGCGAGRMSRFLTDRGCAVQGVDLSPGMIAMARRDHPDIDSRVGSITALPFADASFDAALYWYSIIHIADADLAGVLAEARRVLRPGGVALLAFQAGEGARDVGPAYRALGYDVALTRIDRHPDEVSALAAAAGLIEAARLVRRPHGAERTDQAFLLVRAAG